MKIWVHLNGVQQGPYTFDQLRQLPVDAETPVWYDGLPQWMPAGQAPATAPLFAEAAGPEMQQAPLRREPRMVVPDRGAAYAAAPDRPSTFLVWSILLTVLCCSPFSIAAIVTGAVTNARYNSGNYEGARRMSNATEWLVILSIVTGIVFMPLSMIMWL